MYGFCYVAVAISECFSISDKVLFFVALFCSILVSLLEWRSTASTFLMILRCWVPPQLPSHLAISFLYHNYIHPSSFHHHYPPASSSYPYPPSSSLAPHTIDIIFSQAPSTIYLCLSSSKHSASRITANLWHLPFEWSKPYVPRHMYLIPTRRAC